MPYIGYEECATSSGTAAAWARMFPLASADTPFTNAYCVGSALRILVHDPLVTDAAVIGVPFAQRDPLLPDGPGPSMQYDLVIRVCGAIGRQRPHWPLVASGAHAPPGPDGRREAEYESACKHWINEAGICPTRVFQETESLDTFRQAKLYPEIVRQAGHRQAILVANYYQAYRALALCRKAAPDIRWLVFPVLHERWDDNAKKLLTKPGLFLAREAAVIAASPLLSRMKD